MKSLYMKIINIMGRLSYVQKGEKKVNDQYRFVSHDQVAALFHPEFVAEKIVVLPSVIETSTKTEIIKDKYGNDKINNLTTVMLKTTFINAENPEERFDVQSIGFGIDSQDKGAGKATSYAYKYALLKVFVLETGDDPDNDQNNEFGDKMSGNGKSAASNGQNSAKSTAEGKNKPEKGSKTREILRGKDPFEDIPCPQCGGELKGKDIKGKKTGEKYRVYECSHCKNPEKPKWNKSFFKDALEDYLPADIRANMELSNKVYCQSCDKGAACYHRTDTQEWICPECNAVADTFG